MSGEVINNHAAFIWSVADLLRGVYKQSEYGRVILPLTVLRRLDCVLEPTKADVLERLEELPVTLRNREPLLEQAAGQSFFNTSRHSFATLLGDPDNVAREPAQLHRAGSPSPPVTSSTSSTSTCRSTGSTTTTSCTWWWRSLRTSI